MKVMVSDDDKFGLFSPASISMAKVLEGFIGSRTGVGIGMAGGHGW